MRRLEAGCSLSDVTGAYGQDWSQGVLAEHVGLVGNALRRVSASGRLYVYEFSAGRMASAVPVLCGELVEIWTEDGRIDGRCGGSVYGMDGFACPGHSAQIEEWRSERF